MDSQTKTHSTSSVQACQNCKQEFVIEPEDFDFYEKMKVPPPTWCPECRMIRRMMWRNERKLFRRKDARTGKDLLSLYPVESEWPVYHDDDWWNSDLWDALAYGRNFDPQKPFLIQLFNLCSQVPKFHADAINMVNSEYSGNAADMKNCYLVFNSAYNEDCGYGNGFTSSKNCYDGSYVNKSERCYGSFWIDNCYETHFSSQCDNCVSVWFSKDCRGCSYCVACVNLRSKKYCIFNEQFDKKEYERRVIEMKLDTWSGFSAVKDQSDKFWLKFPNKYIQGVQNVNVSGAYIANSKNVKKSYLIRGAEDIAYVQYGQYAPLRDSMDVTVTGETELIYESTTSGWSGSQMKFCYECWPSSRELEYCLFCVNGGANLFGCVGISKNQYCILNKQYSKEDYTALREKIIKQMNEMPYIDKTGRVYKYGEFFPPEFSPFAYQQTIVPEHFSMNQQEVEAFGARWQEPSSNEYQTTATTSALPDAIGDVKDDALKEIIQCSNCKRAYRIIQPELQFLRQMKIPLPRMCVDCRHDARIAQRNKTKLYLRQCDCGKKVGSYTNTAVHFHGDKPCPNEFETSYASDRPEIVYCEQCYQQEVL